MNTSDRANGTSPIRALRLVTLSAMAFRRGHLTLAGVTEAVRDALLREVTIDAIHAALVEHRLVWHCPKAKVMETSRT